MEPGDPAEARNNSLKEAVPPGVSASRNHIGSAGEDGFGALPKLVPSSVRLNTGNWNGPVFTISECGVHLVVAIEHALNSVCDIAIYIRILRGGHKIAARADRRMAMGKGLARGKTIDLEEPLPYPEGQWLSVSVEPLEEQLPSGSPALILWVMQEPP